MYLPHAVQHWILSRRSLAAAQNGLLSASGIGGMLITHPPNVNTAVALLDRAPPVPLIIAVVALRT